MCLSDDLRVELIQGPTDPECGYADSADFFTCGNCGHTSFDCVMFDADDNADDEEEWPAGALVCGGVVLATVAAWCIVLLPIYLIFP
jgi:hypothetical protein